MPKKATNGRSGAQRRKSGAQKSFALVRPEAAADMPDVVPVQEADNGAKKQAVSSEPAKQEEMEKALPKGSAAARMAARRRTGQQAQQRSAASLITAEHFSYVRKDLMTIAALASIMFATIIVLYITIGQA